MSGGQMTGLTFAEAYELRRAIEESRRSKVRKEEVYTIVTNMSDLEAVMNRMVNDLNEESKGVIRHAKGILSQLPLHFAKHVTEWTDANHLDLLHHVIINNKSDLLTFILSETNFFPVNHAPLYNPYAHLAAILGHMECLRTILFYRPNAFFKSDRASHAIKLPHTIMRKTKLNEPAKVVPKTAEKLLEKIKFSNKDEELKLQGLKEDSDFIDELAQDLGTIEKNFVKSKRRLPTMPIAKDKIKSDRRRSVSKEKVDKSTEETTFRPPPATLPTRNIKYGPGVSIWRRDQTKEKEEQHVITVHWNALPDIKPGVVNGVGAPATVKFAPGAHTPRPDIDLDRINFDKPFAISSTAVSTTRHRTKSIIDSPASSLSKSSLQSKKALKTFEVGVRGSKKYKEFHLKPLIHTHVDKDDPDKYMNKTPLTYAAERGHLDCVQVILDNVVLKRHPTIATKEPLTLATKARCAEAIMLLLEKKTSKDDYQSAVMLAIREMYPDCLTALMSNKSKDRAGLFDGINMYHILYSQSVISSKRYELMPEMTRALISCKEDVNAHNIPRTFPMYTLITCAFNITDGKQVLFFIDCLHILLQHKANPHFDEEKFVKNPQKMEKFSRSSFNSAINCVLESAKNSLNYFEKTFWSKTFMKKFITTIEQWDLTPRRILNNVLFDYMDTVTTLGLDRTIVRCLLRYGGNPDHKRNNKFAINVYFDHLLPYLTHFEMIDTYDRYRQELETLMIVCRSMSLHCLSEAMRIFLADHLLSAPIQALPISREFASKMDTLLRTPRPLSELVAQFIWLRTRRNKKKVKQLPILEGYKTLIIP